MPRVALFAEDVGHLRVLSALLLRLAREVALTVEIDVQQARGGRGTVLAELQAYLRGLHREDFALPDLVLVATDANCQGAMWRRRVTAILRGFPGASVCAIPDPHVERWLLLDGAAFRSAVGRGCRAPDQKCDKDRYKQALLHAVTDAGAAVALGGIEFAEPIIAEMDLQQAARADRSLARFLSDLRAQFAQWTPR